MYATQAGLKAGAAAGHLLVAWKGSFAFSLPSEASGSVQE
jgi:hypothetical protein